MPMLNGAVVHVGGRDETRTQRFRKLIQKYRYSVLDFRFGRRWERPYGNLGPATTDQLVAVLGYEFVQHGRHKYVIETYIELFRKGQGFLSNLRQRRPSRDA